MKRLMFVINPAAGRSIIRDNLMGIVKTFSEEDYIVSIYMTKKRGDATRFVYEDAKNYDLLVCAGGDGTLNETIQGLMQGNICIPLGYIPAGTTNDFATSHGLSKFPRQAAKHIMNGQTKPHDIGKFNGKAFAYVAACGLFTDVSFSTPQSLKNAFGRLAYYFEGARKLTDLTHDFLLTIDIDGKSIKDRYCFLAVTNSLSLGGVLQFPSSYVSLSDGILEVLAIRSPQNPIEFQRLMRSLMDKDYNNDIIRCFHGRNLYIKSDKPIAWTLDGENGGITDEAIIEVSNQKLSFIY